MLTSGGSAAALNALVTAREAAGNPERATVYMSDQSHSAQVRAARIIGIRPEHLRILPTGADFRMDPDTLATAVAADRAAGRHPIAVCADAGSTSTGAIDPLPAIVDYCETEGIWLHVDAAYGGALAILPAEDQPLGGIERADSIGIDPHKWLFQPYEVGCLLVKDARKLSRAFGIHHDILQDMVWGARHPNGADHGLQLSRRDRALKIWLSIRTFGMAAFRAAVAQGVDLANRAASCVESSPTLELLTPASAGILCFRVNPVGAELDEAELLRVNKKVLARVFWDGHAFISSTSLHDTFALRMCVINHTTTWDDVRETLENITRFGMEAAASAERIE